MVHRLYGSPGSLYTGKARSYLIKQGISFEPWAARAPRFQTEIVPKIGRWIIPVLESADGEIVQDGSDIIAHFETGGATRHPAVPQTPRHRLVARIFELFGGEGLLRPAMHYRWNFDETNRAFLLNDFTAALAAYGATEAEKAETFARASGRMRKAMAGFGVSPETMPAIEDSYAEFLRLFDEHLAGSPYLLGGRPTLGDYGLIGPLYAHLARDPYPSDLMKRTAYRVWRWTERMNSPSQDAGEYGNPPSDLFAADAVPETLKRLLRFVAEDYLPEVEAFVGFTNSWLAQRPEMPDGVSGMPRTQDRVIGQVDFAWRGLQVRVNVLPYRLYLLQKIQVAYDEATISEQVDMNALLTEVGLQPLVNLRAVRRIERRDHLEVWSAPLGAI